MRHQWPRDHAPNKRREVSPSHLDRQAKAQQQVLEPANFQVEALARSMAEAENALL